MWLLFCLMIGLLYNILQLFYHDMYNWCCPCRRVMIGSFKDSYNYERMYSSLVYYHPIDRHLAKWLSLHTGNTTLTPMYSRCCMSLPSMRTWSAPTRLRIVSVGSVAVAICISRHWRLVGTSWPWEVRDLNSLYTPWSSTQPSRWISGESIRIRLI